MGSENEEVKRLREKLKLTKEKLRACKAERDFLAQENEQLKEKLMQIHSLSYVSELMLSPRTSSESPVPNRKQASKSSKKEEKKEEKKRREEDERDRKVNKQFSGFLRSKQLDSSSDSASSSTTTARMVSGGYLAPSAGSKSSSSSSSSVQRKTSSNDMLALATACLDGNFAEAQRLIEAGHDINYRDRNNWTPLHCSSSAGNIDIVDYLLKQESIIVNGIFAVNNDGNTALHYLVRHARTDEQYERVLRTLLAKGVDVNLANKNGETPLHAACFRGNKVAVNILLEAGSNPNAKNVSGETCLHYAVRAGAKDLILLLLKYGADPRLAGSNLQGTPLDLAEKSNLTELAQILKDPKYSFIPISLHSIGMEKYVPLLATKFDEESFKHLKEEDLVKLNVPEEDRKKILDLVARLREAKEIVLEEMAWEINIEKEIGRGAYGVVYRGRWRGRDVAVKQLIDPNPALVEDFMAEIKIMKHVRLHENIVNLLGVCKSPHIAIVSEFIEMGSLDRLLPTLRLEIEDIVRIARATAAGIFYLHSNNVIHRDIACRNLLAYKDARNELTVKLTDFGMSRFNVGDSPGQSNEAKGPLKWMAPEALEYTYVKKTDIWAFGVTLVEILTKGGDPYPGETPLEVALAVRDENKTPNIPPDTPPELEVIMKDCWKRIPDERPAADELVTRLDQYLFRLRQRVAQLQRAAPSVMASNEHFEIGFAGHQATAKVGVPTRRK